MRVLDYMAAHGHEQVLFCQDEAAGLRAIIAVHDTTLGPALGGCRMWPYEREEDAVDDVLRLSQAMTYKSATAGLPLGGGKAVIIGDPARDKSEALFRALGRFVDTLGGRYVTTEDVGTTVSDMEWVALETRHVTGLPLYTGSSGDPSPATALGVWQGMKAAAGAAFGSEDLAQRTVAVQGVGKVGYQLLKHLHEEGCRLIVSDINEGAAQRAAREFGAELALPEAVYDVACDIFAPCALGAVLNSDTIPRLRCRVVAGAANNQLASDEDGDELARRGILYTPDYVINAGGVINLSVELEGEYDAEVARGKVMAIHDTVARVIELARAQGIGTARAADKLAEERIAAVRRLKHLEVRSPQR